MTRTHRGSGQFNIINILYLGLIISGGLPSSSVGKLVEVFVPSTGQHCTLPDLPAERYDHTMEGREVCGGTLATRDTQKSCLTLTANGTWERATTLLEKRQSNC